MRVAPLGKLLCTARCDKPLVCQDKVPLMRSCRPSGTSLLPLATMPLRSTARKVQGFLRAWLSMLLPIATHTTVPIVTAAVILNRPTDKTLKCTNRGIRVLPRTTRQCHETTEISVTDMKGATYTQLALSTYDLRESSRALTTFFLGVTCILAVEACDGLSISLYEWVMHF
jgi:hypothetical protein